MLADGHAHTGKFLLCNARDLASLELPYSEQYSQFFRTNDTEDPSHQQLQLLLDQNVIRDEFSVASPQHLLGRPPALQ